MNFHNRKTQRIMSIIIVVLLVSAMVIALVASAF